MAMDVDSSVPETAEGVPAAFASNGDGNGEF
jgi:hypothetical protein